MSLRAEPEDVAGVRRHVELPFRAHDERADALRDVCELELGQKGNKLAGAICEDRRVAVLPRLTSRAPDGGECIT